MVGYDYDFFWRAAQAYINGQSPYSVTGFFSPFPFVLAMIPFGMMPYNLSFGLWSVLSLMALVYVNRSRFPRLIFYLPVIYTLWVGQVDLMILALGFSATWLGVALTTLKPQLAIFILPYAVYGWWRKGQTDQIWKMGIAVIALYGLPTALSPGWWSDWMSSTPSIFEYSLHASSLFGISALISYPTAVVFAAVALVGGIVFWVIKPVRENGYWSWVALFNPIANIYSLCVINRLVDWIAILLSWVLLPISLSLHTGLPWAIIPLYTLWRGRLKKPVIQPLPTQ